MREREAIVRRVAIAVACTAALAAASLVPSSAAGESLTLGGHGKHVRSAGKTLRATIRRTKYGVPHIKANSVESLTAGYAYAFAEDNICTLANEYVTVAAHRSRYFGPDATWTFSGNGMTYKNEDSDFYFGWVKKQNTVRELMHEKPPLGPKRGVRAGVKGFVAGYNGYLEDVGVNHIPDPRCQGAPWVHKIKQIDVYRRFYQLGILGSSGAVIDGIVNAAPVSAATGAQQDAQRNEMLRSGEGLERLQPDLGSNAYGLGGEATQNGRGMVLGNPHFPWNGAERLYQAQLQIPGRLDVEGGSLYGVPLVLIGHTRGLAWSHTVATAWRFTPFALTLVPGDPHSYLVDGKPKQMEATNVTIDAKTGDGGSTEKLHRTIYSTIYGPMIDNLVGIPLPWTDTQGFALDDVNATNFRYLNHFFDTDQAQTVRQYDKVERRYQGIPWVNSVAADSKGHAYYSMQGAIPYVTDEMAQRCNVLGPVYAQLGLPVLNGSDSSCAWRTKGDGVAAGTFPPDKVPTLFRDDYVHNGNDSHWLSNPEQPLTGYDRIIGIENAERTFRTRIGLIQIAQRLAGTDGLPGRGFNLKLLEKVALGNRQYLGELWRDDLVRFCDLAPGGLLVGSSGPVDVSEACDVLRAWDVRDNLGSKGALLFRRFAANLLDNFPYVPTGLEGGTYVGGQTIWKKPYSNSDPVHRPSGLNTGNPLVGVALADAVTDLKGANIPLDAPLRGYQYAMRGGNKIPIHGGPGTYGVFNAIYAPWDPKTGYGDVDEGSSFIMAAEFTGGKCPVRAGTFVTYSESENQASKHAGDYTKAFSQKRWNREAFCGADVRRETVSKKKVSFPARPGKR